MDCPDMTEASQRTRFKAGPLTFIVRHELWDGNIHDHADQGVSIVAAAQVAGKETALLRFNCFDYEKATSTGRKTPIRRRPGPECWKARPQRSTVWASFTEWIR
jgi:hypothetical protein